MKTVVGVKSKIKSESRDDGVNEVRISGRGDRIDRAKWRRTDRESEREGDWDWEEEEEEEERGKRK
jgi:hypothetical protein